MAGKIKGKFYPLNHQEWLKACKELKPAERDLLYYIRTLDPHSDGKELSVSAIAADLNRDKGTVSRALQALSTKGFVETELIKVKVKVLGLGVLCTDNPVVSTQPPLSPHNPGCLHTTPVVSTQHSKSPEPTSNKTSSDLPKIQTYKTYKDFKDSLSESERESFENFCRNEVAGLSRPIVSLGDYLASSDASGQPRYLELYQRFSSTVAGQEARSRRFEQELTEALYEQWDREFRSLGCDYFGFAGVAERGSDDWELRVKFCEEWDRRNLNAVPVLH